ncbi:MAG: cytochrome ubiquinol oxidase subunit I [Chloroflexota bacterium]|nr:cytochrome ubiquinol oxidase subunit I [Chloroflexota bacterium]
MDTLTAARVQMEVSLGFHMVFAAVGMAMPLMMLIAEGRYLRTGDRDALHLAKTWAKVTAVLFAIGAVSGTALSFELGLLWPRFMAFAGPLIGMAFALEGYAFFIEAIFLGLYLYGWNRLSPRAHWLCGVPVAVSGALSGILVVSANAWMQSPVGFSLGPDGLPVDVDPLAALFNPAWPTMAAHSTISTYQAVGFAAAGVYAWALLRNRVPARRHYNRLAVLIAISLGTVAAVLQPFTGDLLAKRAHQVQPAKLAAMEGQFQTERGAPLRIGGLPDPTTGETRWAIEIPGALSVLATGSPNGEVQGLASFPRDQWPNVVITHLAFQVMVGAGVAMIVLGMWFLWAWWRGRKPSAVGSAAGRDWAANRPLLWSLVLASPLGFLALEAGWIVTEVGRQPWIIYGVMRTSEAVTPAVEVGGSLAAFVLLYTGLAVALVALLRRLSHTAGDEHGSGEASSGETPDADSRPAVPSGHVPAAVYTSLPG